MASSRPVSGYKFSVTCKMFKNEVGFAKVSGLESETAVVEYREGGGPLTVQKLRGLESHPVVVLEKGVSGPELIKWYKMVSNPEKFFKGESHKDMTASIEITLKDREGGPKTTFKLMKAWPCKVTYDDLDAASSDVLVHRLEICHEGITFSGNETEKAK